ncbi:hypothetical protein HNR40_008112 [Nonomuraea endophytica]|uniref:Uncharacterized protein n=1 Tax=Nonomuraea endophytica TaxID=714136 RepID=A0A7W8EKH5_9ACTN|nr:hypothetical protein [Nonomuraea endophytica]
MDRPARQLKRLTILVFTLADRLAEEASVDTGHLPTPRPLARPAWPMRFVDGTPIGIDRVVDQEPYYSGKHKCHGENVPIVADSVGRLI